MTSGYDSSSYILSIDSGTSGCKASIWDERGRMLQILTEPLGRIVPRNGYVEQDPEVIWETQLKVARYVILLTGIKVEKIRSIGIANQRETVIAWDSTTGRAVHNAISWMDRRTQKYGNALRGKIRTKIKQKTGLVVDPYFSALKMMWLLEELRKKQGKKALDKIKLGTVDSWLVWKLTAGKVHVTDWSNASRTMLFNIRTGSWDQELLDRFSISEDMLPEVVDSLDPGIRTDRSVLGEEISIGGILGDQQASLFGQRAFEKGETKTTYGTGSFLLTNAGNEVPETRKLITTVAWKVRNQKPVYAIEGSSFNTGSLIDWIRDELKLLHDSSESELMALSTPADHGVYFVPALTGLGAPYWNSKVEGVIFGITPKVTQKEIVRSALESIAYRIRDMVESIRSETGITPKEMRVDGKPSANGFLMQFQSDILYLPVLRYANREMTSAGVAYMSGIAEDLWDINSLKSFNPVDRKFVPGIEKSSADRYYRGWKKAIRSAISLYS